jgi:hypothetical protein
MALNVGRQPMTSWLLIPGVIISIGGVVAMIMV